MFGQAQGWETGGRGATSLTNLDGGTCRLDQREDPLLTGEQEGRHSKNMAVTSGGGVPKGATRGRGRQGWKG